MAERMTITTKSNSGSLLFKAKMGPNVFIDERLAHNHRKVNLRLYLVDLEAGACFIALRTLGSIFILIFLMFLPQVDSL